MDDFENYGENPVDDMMTDYDYHVNTGELPGLFGEEKYDYSGAGFKNDCRGYVLPIVYHSAIAWWVWLVMIGTLAFTYYLADINTWMSFTIIGIGLVILFAVLIFGCRYVIDGNELIDYQLFRPMRFQISNIMDVRKTTGGVATAGMSHRRVSIRFKDRSEWKSYAPLEISPRDRDCFISHLISINPDIIEIK